MLPDQAVARFMEENKQQLQEVEKQAEELRTAVLDALDDVETVLQELSEYEDDNTRVQDVASNVSHDRLRQIEKFDAPADPDAFHTAMEELIKTFRSVSRKEQAVLDHIGDPVKRVFRRIDTLEEHVDRLEEFLSTDHTVSQAYQDLQDHVSEWGELREERTALKEGIETIDTDTLRARIDDVEEQLTALKDHPEQKKKEELTDVLEELKAERDTLQKDVARAASKMERGLKKLLYAARNGDASMDTEHLQVLETIRDVTASESRMLFEQQPQDDAAKRITHEHTTPAADVADAVTAAVERVEDIDLGDRQQKKFENGADQLQNLDEIRDKMEQLNDQIAEKQEQLNDLEIDDRRSELEQKRDRLKQNLRDRIDERETLRQRINDKEQAIEEKRAEIESLLNEHVYNDITVEPVT